MSYENACCCYHGYFAVGIISRNHWSYCVVQKLKKDYDGLVKGQASAKKQLEEETIMRVDLENRIQSLKEEVAFLSEVHKQVSFVSAVVAVDFSVMCSFLRASAMLKHVIAIGLTSVRHTLVPYQNG